MYGDSTVARDAPRPKTVLAGHKGRSELRYSEAPGGVNAECLYSTLSTKCWTL